MVWVGYERQDSIWPDRNTHSQLLQWAYGESSQQRALLGLCTNAIDDVHVDLQHTKRAASQVYQGTKAVARECTKAVLEVHDTIQQMRVDMNMALKQVT